MFAKSKLIDDSFNFFLLTLYPYLAIIFAATASPPPTPDAGVFASRCTMEPLSVGEEGLLPGSSEGSVREGGGAMAAPEDPEADDAGGQAKARLSPVSSASSIEEDAGRRVLNAYSLCPSAGAAAPAPSLCGPLWRSHCPPPRPSSRPCAGGGRSRKRTSCRTSPSSPPWPSPRSDDASSTPEENRHVSRRESLIHDSNIKKSA